MNYAKSLPKDKNGETLQQFAVVALSQARVNTDNAVASSVISLNPNTTSLEVSAVGGQGIAIRWIPATETAAVSPFASVISSGLTANFDHHIQPGTTRRFVVPVERQGSPLVAGAQIGSVAGLYQRVARINAGATASSVLIAEF